MTKIVYKDLEHEYFSVRENGTAKKLRSVTQAIKAIEPEFKKELIAKSTAKKQTEETREYVDAQDILDEWEMKGEVACLYGDSIHKTAEMLIKYGAKPKTPHLLKFANAFEEIMGENKWATEIMFGNEELDLAGRLDEIEMVDPKKKIVNLWDIKTFAELQKKNAGKFKPPLEHLRAHPIVKAGLQLNLYRILVEMHGYTVAEMGVLHWDGEQIVKHMIGNMDDKLLLKAINKK